MDAVELGYFDGLRGEKVGILPLLGSPSQSWLGQEYLGLYPLYERINFKVLEIGSVALLTVQPTLRSPSPSLCDRSVGCAASLELAQRHRGDLFTDLGKPDGWAEALHAMTSELVADGFWVASEVLPDAHQVTSRAGTVTVDQLHVAAACGNRPAHRGVTPTR